MTQLPPETEGGRPRRVPGPWKMAGQTTQMIGVVQDTDRLDRYHSTLPGSGGWFHHLAALYPAYTFAP